MKKTYNIAVVGLGQVGIYLLNELNTKKKSIETKTGSRINLVAISAKNIKKKRKFKFNKKIFYTNPLEILKKHKIDILFEAIGLTDGVSKKIVEKALISKVHVITPNKALISKHGNYLAKLAEKNNVNLEFEASVAGGIPILRSIKEGLATNKISKIYGILNGTSNYILSEMENSNQKFNDVLIKAQKLGYAEPGNPKLDLNGFDAFAKVRILSALAFNSKISHHKCLMEGIEKIELKPSIELFEKEKDIALKKYKEKKESSSYNTLSIFKNRLCLLDEDHGGTVYIPTRIVKESKDWDYSKVDLKDFNFQNLIDEEMIPSKDPTYSDLEYGQELGLKEEQVKKLNLDLIRESESEVRDHIDSFSFNEPMKYIHVNQYWYLDQQLECLDWFEYEEIAEFHGLRYEDCDEASRWCDG